MKKFLGWFLLLSLIAFDYIVWFTSPQLKSGVLIIYLLVWIVILEFVKNSWYKIGTKKYLLSDIVFFTTLLNFAIIGSISTCMVLK